jgi:hypothetical protein
MIFETYQDDRKLSHELFLRLTLSEKIGYIADLLCSDREKRDIIKFLRAMEIRTFDKYKG